MRFRIIYSSTANNVIPNNVRTNSWTGLTLPSTAPYAMRQPATQKSALIRLRRQTQTKSFPVVCICTVSYFSTDSITYYVSPVSLSLSYSVTCCFSLSCTVSVYFPAPIQCGRKYHCVDHIGRTGFSTSSLFSGKYKGGNPFLQDGFPSNG